jgi:hypothetical protein
MRFTAQNAGRCMRSWWRPFIPVALPSGLFPGDRPASGSVAVGRAIGTPTALALPRRRDSGPIR